MIRSGLIVMTKEKAFKDKSAYAIGAEWGISVFLDKSGCNTDMTRRYAYALGGGRGGFRAAYKAEKHNHSGLYSVGRDAAVHDFFRWDNGKEIQAPSGKRLAALYESRFSSHHGQHEVSTCQSGKGAAGSSECVVSLSSAI